MKAVVCADPHIGFAKNDELWLAQAEKLFDQMIDTCHRKDVYTLIILGDLFHDRKSLGLKALQTVMKIADKLKTNNIYTYLIIGNHDTFYKNEISVNSLKIFAEHENIKVIEQPLVVGDVGFTSWGQTTELECDYLFGHFEINGFPVTNTLTFEKSFLNVSDFKKYKKVISGHFHIPSNSGNVIYLGAPYHMTFNDVGSLRGYYYFDEGDIEFIEFDGVKFYYVSTEEKYNPKKITGNIIKLIYEKDYGTVENNKKLEKLQSLNPARYSTDFSKISKELQKIEGTSDITLKNNKEILFDFMDLSSIPDNINPVKLKEIVNMLLEEME